MTELEIVESLYPDGAALSPDERSRLRAELFGTANVQPVDASGPPATTRRAMAVAAALLVGCGGAGVWFALDRRAPEGGADVTPVSAPATVPATLPLPQTTITTTTQPTAASAAPVTTSTVAAAPPAVDGASTLFELSAQVGATIDLAFAAIDGQTQACLRSRGVEGVATPTYLLGFGEVVADELPWNMPNDSPDTDGYANAPDRVDTEVIDPPEGSAASVAMYGEIVGTWSDDDPEREPASAVGGDLRDGCLPVAQLDILGGGDPVIAQDLGDAAYRLGEATYASINAVTVIRSTQQHWPTGLPACNRLASTQPHRTTSHVAAGGRGARPAGNSRRPSPTPGADRRTACPRSGTSCSTPR